MNRMLPLELFYTQRCIRNCSITGFKLLFDIKAEGCLLKLRHELSKKIFEDARCSKIVEP